MSAANPNLDEAQRAMREEVRSHWTLFLIQVAHHGPACVACGRPADDRHLGGGNFRRMAVRVVGLARVLRSNSAAR
jgi:hypothetical protein